MLKLCLVFLFFITLVSSEKFRFDNCTLYKVQPKYKNEIKLLQELAHNDKKYDFWTEPGASVEFVNIKAGLREKTTLAAFLNFYEIDVAMQNVQE